MYHFLLSGQTFGIIVSTGRVVRYVRAELPATGRAVHGPSCPRAELSGYQIAIFHSIKKTRDKVWYLKFEWWYNYKIGL